MTERQDLNPNPQQRQKLHPVLILRIKLTKVAQNIRCEDKGEKIMKILSVLKRKHFYFLPSVIWMPRMMQRV